MGGAAEWAERRRRSGLSAEADADALFDAIDASGKGYVTAADITLAARALGTVTNEACAQRLLESHARAGERGIRRGPFREFVAKREEELEELFEKVIRIGAELHDQPTDQLPATLQLHTLAAALAELGIAATQSELHDFITRLDRDRDGKVSFWEFRALMLLQPVASLRACFSRMLGDTRADKLFREVDSTGDGYVDAAELVAAARLARVPLSKPQAYELLGGQRMSREEFTAFLRSRESELKRVFRQMVSLGDPDIGREEYFAVKLGPGALRRALSALGIRTSDSELRAFIKRLDRDCDGAVNYTEFRDFATYLPATNAAACFEQVRQWGLEAADGQHTPPVEAEDDHEKSIGEKLAEKLLSGGAAGVCSRTATAPVDRVKVLMQATRGEPLSIGSAARQIAVEGGWRAFFRGNGANCLKVAPETATRFLVFDLLKSYSTDPDAPSAAERFTAGGLAGACAQTLVYPLEIAKTRLALSPPGLYPGIRGCLGHVWRHEGASALFAGLAPSIAGIVPYAAIDLGVNSMLKELACEYYKGKGSEPTVAALLATGMCSSSVAMLCTYPLNLVRTLLQAQGLPDMPKYDSSMDIVREAFRARGFFGLYRGLVPNMVKVLPATSISYTVYGKSCEFFKHRKIFS
eukprot:Hpha_TRINITY_DN34849_c0_g1::TRINITY_DN34849_c0_g1_i1::g.167809::m.167809/K14684/SLC25A23S; solute carrier family 25 (mitochondrial phosphate transporter), member 23/24/25/41